MDKANIITLKIINDQTVLDGLVRERQLTEAQKEMIRFIARTTVEEYVKAQNAQQPLSFPERIMRLPEVKRMTGLSASTIYKSISDGGFPKPIKLGSRSVGWKESQMTDWLNREKKSQA